MIARPVGTLAAALIFMASVAPLVASGEPLPQRLVVGFVAGHAPAVGSDLHGAKVLSVDADLSVALVEPKNRDAFEKRAARDASVAYVESDDVYASVASIPNDPRFSSQYHHDLVGTPAAWDVVAGSGDVTVCVADTGLRYTHEDLVGSYVGGYDFVNGDTDPWDDHGHGTHVSGIVAAVANNSVGIAGMSHVRLLHAKVLGASGTGALSVIASGITWCVNQGADVISLSLVASSGSKTLQRAVDQAWSKGVVLTAAAGNAACGGGKGCVSYPAKYSNVIAVGCVDSARAPCSWASSGPEMDLAAPGVAVLSTHYTSNESYAYFSGTSQATPIVAGAAALLLAADPSLTNVEIRALLQAHAEDVGVVGQDPQTGAGLVRVDLAIAALS
jgi:subtilisin family serine protease